MMDLNDVVFRALFDWTKLALPAMTVSAEKEEATKPGANYICIPMDYEFIPQGRPHFGPIVADERAIMQDYSGRAAIWEVGGTGDSLRVLAESLVLQKVQLLLQAAGVNVRYMEKAQDLSQVLGGRWLLEARAVAAISVRSVTHETIKAIEHVENTLGVQ